MASTSLYVGIIQKSDLHEGNLLHYFLALGACLLPLNALITSYEVNP